LLSSSKILSLVERADGEIWFGTSQGDLSRTVLTSDASAVKLAWHFHSPITALAEDHEGNLWIGTANEGLHRLKKRQLRWIPIPERLDAAWPPSFFETPKAELRFVAGDRGLYRCQNGRFGLLQRLALPDGAVVQTVCGTGSGEYWIGTVGDGLFRCNPGVLQQFSEQDGLSDSAIEAICANEDGSLWVATRNGGLNHLEGHTVTRFNTPWGFWNGYACVLEKDREGNLWVGTTGDGLFQLVQGRFVAYTETNGLPSSQIHALYADPDGSLWVGTAKGLCRLRAGRVTVFSGRNGLPKEAILQLHSDDEGHLWVGCNSGISRLSIAQLNAWAEGRADFIDAVPFGEEDGLHGIQCLTEFPSQVGRSGKSDEIWISTTKGLVSIKRRGLQFNDWPPAVVLEEVLVDGQRVPFSRSLRVAPGKQSLGFRYTALSLTAPGKILFRYQLEGLDRGWTDLSASRTARYTEVPPGKYRFRIIARNNDGVWNEVGASVAIVVAPFWWATNWFRLSLAAAAVGILGSLYRARKARHQELERLRVRIAGDLHDDIGANLWSITLLSRILGKDERLGAEQRQDVNEINRIAVQSSNSIRDIIWLINPVFDTMQDLVLRTKDFAGTVLRGVDYRVRYEGTSLGDKLPFDFRQNLFLVFKEALTNIARHAKATEVEARIEEGTGIWRFTIHDNGRGFDPAAVTSGHGIKNLRARATNMGAEFELRSRPGQGTTLVFTVPRP
jgi:signal transduction histidine kinase/ligand-binding sensor domain-containing protein